MQSRLSNAAKNLAIQKENLTAAYSRIADIDIADETSRMVAGGVRQQAAAVVLAQANQSPALALRLLSG